VRTDNDSWDITTSVGSTAVMVAAARALEAAKPDPLAVDPYAEVFTRAVGGSWADVLDGKAPEHRLASPEFGVPFVNFQGSRTKYFDAYFAAAAAAGVRQIVLLAAGLARLPTGLAGRHHHLRVGPATGAGVQERGTGPRGR
jgi:O-methyltransferase involved in polyketide biosynthesis